MQWGFVRRMGLALATILLFNFGVVFFPSMARSGLNLVEAAAGTWELLGVDVAATLAGLLAVTALGVAGFWAARRFHWAFGPLGGFLAGWWGWTIGFYVGFGFRGGLLGHQSFWELLGGVLVGMWMAWVWGALAALAAVRLAGRWWPTSSPGISSDAVTSTAVRPL